MADIVERTGTISSGDVSLFYRAFAPGQGQPAGTPMLLMHGTNYYDSTDWVEIGRALAVDRPICAYDKRGFGRSGWSPSKDYSMDAHVSDVAVILGALGWQKAVIMGHSSSGRLAVAFAAHFPDKVAKLVIGDSGFARDEDAPKGEPLGNAPLTFTSVEDAMAHFAKIANPPRMAKDAVRAADGLIRIGEAFMLRRDPDHANREAIGEGAALPRHGAQSVWDDLPGIKCPTLIIRGLRSDRYPPAIVERIRRERPDFAWSEVDSQHDIAFGARDAVIAAVKSFIADI